MPKTRKSPNTKTRKATRNAAHRNAQDATRRNVQASVGRDAVLDESLKRLATTVRDQAAELTIVRARVSTLEAVAVAQGWPLTPTGGN